MSAFEVATLAATGLPRCPDYLPNVPCPLPRWTERVHMSILPRSRGLPRSKGGSASTISLSGPAQASLTLRPARLLNRLTRPLSRGFDTVGYPAVPLVSYQIDRHPIWVDSASTGYPRLRGAPLNTENSAVRSSCSNGGVKATAKPLSRLDLQVVQSWSEAAIVPLSGLRSKQFAGRIAKLLWPWEDYDAGQ